MRSSAYMYVILAVISASKAIHVRLLRHVAKGSMRFFDAAPLDRVLYRFSNDMITIGKRSRSYSTCACSLLMHSDNFQTAR